MLFRRRAGNESPMKMHRTEVLARERFGRHIRLRYRWSGAVPAPGQFVVARAGDPSKRMWPFLPRPFFVHDHDDGIASLLFEIRGTGTELLAENAAEVCVSGPLGQGFRLDGIAGGPVLLLGGGVWVAPLKLLARRLKGLGVHHEICLEVPATAPEAYAQLLGETYPGAGLVPTDGLPGASQGVLSRCGDLARYRAVFASGPSDMLAAVDAACRGGVPAQLALRERMACADGSCFGCAVPLAGGGYARACTEGPVFAVGELAVPSGYPLGEAVASR